MAKISIEVLEGNETSDIAEAVFNSSPSLSDYRFHPQHKERSAYHWELQWVYPEKLFIGLYTIEGLFKFIRYHVDPLGGGA
jgi:hypothetical protein